MDAHRLKDQLPRPQGFFERDQLWRRGNVCAMVGMGGVFKTWFAAFVLGQIGFGKAVNKFQSRQGRTMLLEEELDVATMIERMTKLWDEREAEDLSDNFRTRCNSDFDFFARTAQSQKKLERLWKQEGKPDVIILDALSYIHHGNENSNQDMGIVWGAIKEVARETNAVIPVIHHYGKPGEFKKGADKIRGASVIQNVCSDIWLFDPESGQTIVTIAKHRDWGHSDPPEPFSFKLERRQNGHGVTFAFGGVEKKGDEIDERDWKAVVRLVAEMAGTGGEVLRGALERASGFGEKKFKMVLGHCVAEGMLTRVPRGREVSFCLPEPEPPREEHTDA